MKDVAAVLRNSGIAPLDEVDSALDLFGDTDDAWRNLVDQGFFTEVDFFKAVAEYSSLEFVPLDQVEIPGEIISLLPGNFCRSRGVLPMATRGDHIFLALSDPSNLEAIDEVGSITSFIVAPKVVTESALKMAMDRYLRADEELDKLSGEIDTSNVEEDEIENLSDDQDDAPIVRFVNLLIAQAVQDRASDIHVEPRAQNLIVRFRIDGVLHVMRKADKGIQAGVLSRLKIMADMDIAERRKPQDGRMSVNYQGQKVDIRVAALPTVWGEKIIMRILDHSTEKRNIESMGLSPRNLEIFRDAVSKSHGMVLVTGPTGSGKALKLDTRIPTPQGWTTMGELRVGDKVLDSQGNSTKVVSLSEINYTPQLFKVTFSDGQVVFADSDHQWIAATHDSRNWANRKENKKRVERRANAKEAASNLRVIAKISDPEEIVSQRWVEEMCTLVGAQSFLPRNSVLGALKFMHCWLDPIEDNSGIRYEVFAYQALNLLADRIELRYTASEHLALSVYSTEEMLQIGLDKNGRRNFSVPVAEPLRKSEIDFKELPLDPYVLGVWLGDGSSDGSRICVGYEDYEETKKNLSELWSGSIAIRRHERAATLILQKQKKDQCARFHDYKPGKNYCVEHTSHLKDPGVNKSKNVSLGRILADNKLRNNKHIPQEYLRSSFESRLQLLQGLMDTDGYVSAGGVCGIGLSNFELAKGVMELIRSLGIKARWTEKKTSYRNSEGERISGKTSYVMAFSTTYPVFRLKRKAARLKEQVSKTNSWNYITSIEPISSDHKDYGPVRCITVDSPDHSYLCEDFIVTHNSTTLYTALDEVSTEEKNVITVEDPVEKRIEGVNQVQINNKAGMTFPAALKSILRSDPDIVMIGEIRDEETAGIAVEASMTGHLVLSTLHTNGAPESLARLVEMGVEPYLVGNSVSAVMAQRLARKLCEKCKIQNSNPDKDFLQKLEFPVELLERNQIFSPKGCTECSETGYRGRVSVVEIMAVSEAIERLVVDGAPSSMIRNAALQEGFVSLKNDGFRRVLQGLTTVEEVMRVTS